MKELRTLVWCDHCDALHDGLRADAVVTRVVLIDGKPKQLDLCEIGDKELVRPLLELLTSHGAPYEGELAKLGRTPQSGPGRPAGSTTATPDWDARTPAGRPAWLRCPLCEQPMKRGSLITHALGKHGVQRGPLPTQCPDCDYTSEVVQSMGTHRFKAHDYDAVEQMLTELQQMAGEANQPPAETDTKPKPRRRATAKA